MSGTPATLSVAELLSRAQAAVGAEFPATVWVRGEVSGLNRTTRGAAFFKLVDREVEKAALEVAARGRMMQEVDRSLASAGVGPLRSGIEVRLRGTVGVEPARSLVRLALLEVDPAFTVGRLEMDRQEVMRRLAADGTLAANRRLPVPLVPLRVGLVTSRGSAAHADFVQHLKSSGFRFGVSTVHTSMQGEQSPEMVVAALRRLTTEAIDVVALVRGGGAKLDLAAFDSEMVGRAVGNMPVPVVVGVGHETDRSVADEAAAVSVKTPTDAAEWLVRRVGDYAGRVETARRVIAEEARSACRRTQTRLDSIATRMALVRGALNSRLGDLDHLAESIAAAARGSLVTSGAELEKLDEVFDALGVEGTLRRGFAIASHHSGRIVRSVDDVAAGEELSLRLVDGTVRVVVEEGRE